MCGIMAAFRYSNKYNQNDFINSINKVQHRGPDNTGIYIDEICFLGHTRLSIIDIDNHANQPYAYDNLVMVYNGEIFNYVEIREELVNTGYTFCTTSDTEVVIKAFHKWGTDCFTKFNGMWSLVIYNKTTKEILISRDRFGQKPLFFVDNEDGFFVASEIQQLVDFTHKDINFNSIQMFLKEGNYEENHNETFFTDINDYPKAHYSIIDENNDISTINYWNYWDKNIKKVTEHSFKEFEELFEDSVKIRLKTDVQYGVLLSGGVDSTLIAAYANRLKVNVGKIPAFTYSSNDLHDELKYSQVIADDLDMPLYVSHQSQRPDEYIDRLKQIVKHLGKGHSSPAIVSIDYLYEKMSDNGIKVALDGQGADELLAGYKTDYILRIPLYILNGKFKQAYYAFKDMIDVGLVSQSILFARHILPSSFRKIMRILYGYEKLFQSIKEEKIESRIHKKPIVKNKSILNRFWIKYHDIGLENLLYYGDIIAMKNSIENRSPFMDHRLVDFVFSRSDELKMMNGRYKYVLKTFDDYTKYKEVLERKKVGFSSDIKLNTKKEMVKQLKESPILSWKIFSKDLAEFVNSELILSMKYERFLFRLFQVHLWNEIFIENK
jgi:asparagine synthase (glutamine-hydrolysing)